jgi:hypothetical protein
MGVSLEESPVFRHGVDVKTIMGVSELKDSYFVEKESSTFQGVRKIKYNLFPKYTGDAELFLSRECIYRLGPKNQAIKVPVIPEGAVLSLDDTHFNPIYFNTHNPDSLFGTTSVDNRYRFDLFIDEEQNYILKTKYQGIDIVGNVNSSTLWYPR